MKDLSSILSKVFNNKKFILSLYEGLDSYNSELIEERLATVLEYYLVSKDQNTRYTYHEISDRYDDLMKTKYMTKDESIDYLLNEQFLTHSFNGYKKNRISKYGFDYFDLLDADERKKLLDTRKTLNELETLLKTSPYIDNKEVDKRKVLMCSPGTKTIYYASRNAPERLYLGPLSQETGKEEPIIVGESKASYMMRLLKNKINKMYNPSSFEYSKAIELSELIVNEYCTSSPSFALIRIKDIKDIDVTNSVFDELSNRKYKLNYLIRSLMPYQVKDFFTSNPRDEVETSNLDDIAASCKSIPYNSFSIVDLMDSFDLKQLYAKYKGLEYGDLISYNDCEFIRNANVSELLSTISTINSSNDMNQFDEKYNAVKLSELLRIKMLTSNLNIHEIDTNSLSETRNNLLKERKALLLKDGRPTELEYFLSKFDKSFYKKFLDDDEDLVNDSIQYDSDLHGVSHTRRVNFFASVLINHYKFSLSKDEEKLIYTIIKNHDIGRTSDEEDKEHGINSAKTLKDNSSRLNGFSNDEKELINFVIKEHSLSSKENEKDLQVINPELRAKYKMILNIVKDADKLDRVRLDPFKMFPSEGLDAERLSLDYSKKLEDLAYESYDKLFDVVRIDKDLRDIEELSYLLHDVKNIDNCDTLISAKRQDLTSKQSSFLSEIISRGKEFIQLKSFRNIRFKHNVNKEEQEDELSRSV